MRSTAEIHRIRPAQRSAALFLIASIWLASCNPGLTDPFFDYPYEEWNERATMLPLPRVYGLYKELLSQNPPLGGLDNALGSHGRDAVLIWLDDIENAGEVRNVWEFGPIIEAANRYGGYDLCADRPTFERAVVAVAQANSYSGRETAARLVRESCIEQ